MKLWVMCGKAACTRRLYVCVCACMCVCPSVAVLCELQDVALPHHPAIDTTGRGRSRHRARCCRAATFAAFTALRAPWRRRRRGRTRHRTPGGRGRTCNPSPRPR
jgi:hypothetical protein